MLKLRIPDKEYYDDGLSEFITVKGGDYEFEHSLYAIAEWEKIHTRPFLAKDPLKPIKTQQLTPVEFIDYVKCMCTTELDIRLIDQDLIEIIGEYIGKSQTATTFMYPEKSNNQVATSEWIYANMMLARIPIECEHWNLERLMVMMRVMTVLSGPKDRKMSRSDVMSRNRSINDARRRQLNTKG